jgi:hypothetical protein
MGLSSTKKGNPRLGKVNGEHTIYEEGFSPTSHLSPLLTDSHSPHACPTPGVYTFTVTKIVLRLVNLPCLGLQQQTGSEFSELCGSYKTPSRSSHFICPLSHLERFAHKPGNLLLQPRSNLRRTTRLSKERMKVANHTHPRDCVATTTHS